MKIKHIWSYLWIIGLLLPAISSGFVATDLEKLLSTNECENCDLSEANLEGKTLSKAKLDGVNLSGANLTNTVLRMADLEDANFRNANLTYTLFEAADLYKANFDGAYIEGTVFDGAYLVEAVFGGEQILRDQGKGILKVSVTPETSIDTNEVEKPAITDEIEEEVITSIETPQPTHPNSPVPPKQPEVATIAPPIVKEVTPVISVIPITTKPGEAGYDPGRYAPDPSLNITGFKPLPKDPIDTEDLAGDMFPLSKDDMLDLVDDTKMCAGCDFSDMNLAKVKLKGIYLEGVSFERANLEKANFKAANLKAANLRKANLRGADLREADLYKADLTGADLTGADLEDALIDGAILTGAILKNTILNKK